MLSAAVVSGASAQPADEPTEVRKKAFTAAQTLGPPPAFSVQDVTVLLMREGAEPRHHRKVTYSGTGQTAYVQIAGGREFNEKADTCPPDEILSVVEEAYRAGFFQMGPDYTKTVEVEEESPGELVTYYTELKGDYPKLTVTVRIGDYEKTVTAIDRGEYAARFGTPENLLALADFILARASVVAITEEIEK
jgi:hypothetical protein